MTDDTRSTRERMIAGDLYLADDPDLAAANVAAQTATWKYNASSPQELEERREILEGLLGAIGEGTEIKPPLQVDYGVNLNLHIGVGSFFNFGLVALDVAAIRIGDDCQFGPNVHLLTPTHPIDPSPGGRSGSLRCRSPSATTSGLAAASSSAPA